MPALVHGVGPLLRAARAATRGAGTHVHASTSERDALRVRDARNWAITPPIDAPITWARLDALGVEHRRPRRRHLLERERVRRAGAAADAAVVDRDAAEPPAERDPLERPAPRVGAETLDHAGAAHRRRLP